MARLSLALLGLAMVCAMLTTSYAANAPLSICTRARATHYNTSGNIGACGFGNYRTLYTMAPNEAVYNGSNACGTCYEVTGPDGSEIFMAADECPIQGNEHLCSGDLVNWDVDIRVFDKLAPISTGGTSVAVREIVCPENGNIAVIISEVGNKFYLPIIAFNHRVAVAAISAKDSGTNSNWTKLERSIYNIWPYGTSTTITYPVTLQLTSIYGETISMSIPTAPTTDYQKIDGTTQFTVWTPVAETSCPTVYEYDIFVNGLNDGNGRPVSEYWLTDSNANVAYTGTVPSGNTVAARMNLVGYGEWQFGTRGTAVPLSTISAVEIWVYSPTSVSNVEIAWNTCCDNSVSLGPVNTTWTKHTFTPSQFGSGISDLTYLRIKNQNSAAVNSFTIAGFRLIPTSDVIPVTPSTSGTPSSTPTAAPRSSGTTPSSSSTPTLASPSPSLSTPTASVTPLDEPGVGPATPSPVNSASSAVYSFGLVALLALILALLN